MTDNDEVTVNEGMPTAEPAVVGQKQESVHLDNSVMAQGKVDFCIEKNGKFIGSLEIEKPKARFVIQHPCMFDKPVAPGKHVVCIGELAQGKIFQPCRVEGKTVPSKSGILGKEIVTQFFDLKVLSEEDEGVDQVNVWLVAQLGDANMVAPKQRTFQRFRQQARRDVSISGTNRQREVFNALTGDAIPISVEYFASDFGNRKNVLPGDTVILDVYPAWHPVQEEATTLKGASGQPLIATMKNTKVQHACVVMPLQFRAVIQSRQMQVILDKVSESNEVLLVGETEEAGVVAASAGKIMGLDNE